MGHDFVGYKDKSIRMHDLDIWVLRHFLIKVSKDIGLKKFLEQIEWHGPGVFSDLDFDRYVGDEKSKLRLLLSTIDNAKEYISQFGNAVPLNYLHEEVEDGRILFTGKQPVDQYLKGLANIVLIIKQSENA